VGCLLDQFDVGNWFGSVRNTSDQSVCAGYFNTILRQSVPEGHCDAGAEDYQYRLSLVWRDDPDSRAFAGKPKISPMFVHCYFAAGGTSGSYCGVSLTLWAYLCMADLPNLGVSRRSGQHLVFDPAAAYGSGTYLGHRREQIAGLPAATLNFEMKENRYEKNIE